jgi:hypothetical protein
MKAKLLLVIGLSCCLLLSSCANQRGCCGSGYNSSCGRDSCTDNTYLSGSTCVSSCGHSCDTMTPNLMGGSG